MVHVSRTFTVDKPVGVVVEYLKDFGNAVEWDPGTQECTRIGAGPIQVGSSWLNVSKVLGRTTELTYRLDTLEPGHLVFVGENETATSTDDIRVEPAGDAAAQITYSATIDLHGAAKLGAPVMKLEFEHLGNATEKQLTEVIARL
ncbi:SRPBCC family protein [Jatrophihabitans telluris]|uniref:SRPBCC family protein n=1 Tax=Jatrophihabitans telluris TaxID=2038343 RepID=A0ABY4R112_9ACTN|nr:SRPBCC family protein [Jatrophihabitans telluris]UQX89167.1 SRPBCC family protein [Jatrophihabitans telluris]